MKNKVLYTDEPQAHKSSTLDTIGMTFALLMLCVVLPIAIFIITAGF